MRHRIQNRIDKRNPGIARRRDQKRNQSRYSRGRRNRKNSKPAPETASCPQVLDHRRDPINSDRNQSNKKTAVQVAPYRDHRNRNPKHCRTAALVAREQRNRRGQKHEVE